MKICADNYSVTLGSFSLRDVSLTIGEGEIFGILGETGSGKSVLLEALAGFYEPVSGKITYDGTDVRDIPLEERGIGFVYQDYGLFPHMKVRKNIEFGLAMHRVPKKERRERSDHIMELLGIRHLADRYPGSLSGGEQQRAALARAMILEPRILFMDEPFSALDPNTKQKMYALVRKIHRQYGCTIVFVTHDFREAEHMADRVGIVMKGVLREVCRAEELAGEHQDPEVAGFLAAAGRRDISA